MKFTSVMASRQRQLRVASRLPTFLRDISKGVTLRVTDRFPENSPSLFEIDKWQNECSCYLEGFLYLWRVFFTLYNFVRSSAVPSPTYHPLNFPNDVLVADSRVWVHETSHFTCGTCLPILRKIYTSLATAFLPKSAIVDWGFHKIRTVVLLENSSGSWSRDDAKNFEMATLFSGSILSMILSGSRKINCFLRECKGSDLALVHSVPAFGPLRDVVGGDLLEDEYSISYFTAGRPQFELVVHRAPKHFSVLEPLGSIRFGIRSNWPSPRPQRRRHVSVARAPH